MSIDMDDVMRGLREAAESGIRAGELIEHEDTVRWLRATYQANPTMPLLLVVHALERGDHRKASA